MSPLSRSELSIVLSPERVALLRTERRLTLRGYERRVGEQKLVPCDMDAGRDKPWSCAIAALGAALPSIAARGMEVNVILSNHFMQYALVPWFENLTDEEELALAQHYFSEIYGDVGSLSVRVSPGRAGVAALSSAVASGLLEELGGLLGRMELDLKSIQPHLMVVYNSCRERLADCSAWVALMEPGSVCLAALQKGQLAWIRKLSIGDDWHQELPAILEREACLADTEVETDEVFLWAPHVADLHVPAGGHWKFQQLKPNFRSGAGLAYGGLRALEMGL